MKEKIIPEKIEYITPDYESRDVLTKMVQAHTRRILGLTSSLYVERTKMKLISVVLALVVLAACSEPTAPTQKPEVRSLKAPTTVSTSRYILISGVWTCVEDCENEG